MYQFRGGLNARHPHTFLSALGARGGGHWFTDAATVGYDLPTTIFVEHGLLTQLTVIDAFAVCGQRPVE